MVIISFIFSFVNSFFKFMGRSRIIHNIACFYILFFRRFYSNRFHSRMYACRNNLVESLPNILDFHFLIFGRKSSHIFGSMLLLFFRLCIGRFLQSMFHNFFSFFFRPFIFYIAEGSSPSEPFR